MTMSSDVEREEERKRTAGIEEALARLPGPRGERFAKVFEHGSLLIEVYAPRGTDPQTPHARDEAYIVARGRGEYVVEGGRFAFGPGDFLFAAAGEVHRFENFTEDLVVWVIFYGPEGGERAASV
ncbi:MAG TPA: cupin domain-containing protein [Blastocatellia bacterium]|nr:cupin domain-containing protein [Blastocatellia bacterium]